MPTPNGQRIGLRFPDGRVRYYDIDPDARVYWLRPQRDNRLTRYRVREPAYAEYIRGLAERFKESNNEDA